MNTTPHNYVGRCPFKRQNSSHVWTKLPASISDVNDFICGGLNRTGLLCSECMDDLGVALSHDRDCSECWNNFQGWALYVFLTLFPPTLFFFVVLLFQIKVTSAEMNCFIFSAQFVSLSRNETSYKPTGSLHYSSLPVNIIFGILIFLATFTFV